MAVLGLLKIHTKRLTEQLRDCHKQMFGREIKLDGKLVKGLFDNKDDIHFARLEITCPPGEYEMQQAYALAAMAELQHKGQLDNNFIVARGLFLFTHNPERAPALQ